ncbi:hypothetical protein [Amnibacterium endophyticum]|uniref:DUF4157 domain-containing protein n=1 Tax=Amnibacterium endophyticum TaxID=2109337 RepID=A0ABW4LGC5_9MICO
MAAILGGVTPLLSAQSGAHGYVLSSVGAIAVLVGLRALRRNRVVPNLGVLVLAVAGMGTGVIGTLAMMAVMAASGPTSPARILDLPALQPRAQVTQVQLSAPSTAGGRSDAVVGNGGSVRIGAGYSVRSSMTRPRFAVRLERRIASGAWSPTGVTTSVVEGSTLSVVTPPYSTSAAKESVQYRLASGDSVSAPVSVVYENQGFYTGMAATIYAYAAPYCPTTAVHMTALNGREAGEYSTGASLILVDSSVGVSANLTPASQRALAVHECSHELQWLNYRSSREGNAQMTAAAAVIFTAGSNGAPAIEHAADCGALAVEPNGYLGYGGYCTPAELRAAARLLGGGRY